MKKMLKIKWENIITIFNITSFIICILKHILLSKIDINAVIFEILIYGSIVIVINYIVSDLRKNLIKEVI